jgi:DNA ligase-1
MASIANSIDLHKRTKQDCDEFLDNISRLAADEKERALAYLAQQLGLKVPAASSENSDDVAINDLSDQFEKTQIDTPEKLDNTPKKRTPMPKYFRPDNTPKLKKQDKKSIDENRFESQSRNSWTKPMQAKRNIQWWYNEEYYTNHFTTEKYKNSNLANPHLFGNPTKDHLTIPMTLKNKKESFQAIKDGKKIIWELYDPKKDQIFEWYMSLKIDGMRGLWDGEKMFSKKGNEIKLPEEFTEDFPDDCALDGELKVEGLSCAENAAFFQHNIMKEGTDYSKARYNIFDIPSSVQIFSENISKMKKVAAESDYIYYIPQTKLEDHNIVDEITKVRDAGGEGLILRKDVKYDHPKRAGQKSEHVIKCKPMYESEGTICEINETKTGKPTYKINELEGALYSELPDNPTNKKAKKVGKQVAKTFAITLYHSAPSDLEIGTRVSFGYFALKDSNKPTTPAKFNRVLAQQLGLKVPTEWEIKRDAYCSRIGYDDYSLKPGDLD